MQRNRIRCSQQRLSIYRFGPHISYYRIVYPRIVDQHAHAEAEGTPNNLGADAPTADQSERHGREVFADWHIVFPSRFNRLIARY